MVFAILVIAGVVLRGAAPLFGRGPLTRELILLGAFLSAVSIIGVVVSLIVLAVRHPPGTSTPPGWYPDQVDPDLIRYHDGRSWTSATAPRRR